MASTEPIDNHLWVLDPDEIHRTASALVDAFVLTSAKDVLDFYEKPWKWSAERAVHVNTDVKWEEQ